MSFFYEASPDSSKTVKRAKQLPAATLKKLECRGCPLDKERSIKSPKMEPFGSDAPDIYVLTSSPSKDDDAKGALLSGQSGRIIKNILPKKYVTRYSALVRCTKVGMTNKNLDIPDICCSNKVEKDIMQCRPKVILGLGYGPLKWALGTGVQLSVWTRRWFPVKIGDHTCWFLCLPDPRDLVAKRRNGYPSEDEVMCKHAVKVLPKLLKTTPRVLSADHYDKNIEIITGENGTKDLDRLEELLFTFVDEDYELVGADLETTHLRPYSEGSRILTAAIGTRDLCVAFPLKHKRGFSRKYQKEACDIFEDFLKEYNGATVWHNAIFDMEWLAYHYGKDILQYITIEDTQALLYALDNRKGALGLDIVTRLTQGFWLKEAAPISSRANIESQILEDTLLYNARDSLWTEASFHDLEERLLEERTLDWVYEHTLTTEKTLCLSQLAGIVPNNEKLDEFAEEFQEKIDNALDRLRGLECVKRFKRKFRQDFNWASDKDLEGMFTEVLDIRDLCLVSVRDKWKTIKKFTTNAEVLQKLRDDHDIEIAEILLILREYDKLNGTYVQGIKDKIYPDGLLHTSYNCMYTSTGRLSSSDPNSQNFPKRKHREVRAIIGAPEGCGVGSIDFGQLEARVLAMLSEDEYFCEAVWGGMDIHMAETEAIVDLYPKAIANIAKKYEIVKGDYDTQKAFEKASLKKLRGDVKNGWVFPQFYGSHFAACAQALAIPESVAEKLADSFWSRFKGVRAWQEATQKFYKKYGYVETATGRRRYGPLSYNEIINTPIQGTGSDIVVASMNDISAEAIKRNDQRLQPIMNIHDDLTGYFPKDNLHYYMNTYAEIMTKKRFDWMVVPVLVEAEFGNDWASQSVYGEYEPHKGWKLADQ